jgi:hypothetical protein
VTPKRAKVEPIREPTLFEMDKLEDAGQLANSLPVERTYYEPGLLLGTSDFTAVGWEGSFYPAGMKPRDCLLETAIAPPRGPRKDRQRQRQPSLSVMNAGDQACPETRPCPHPSPGDRKPARTLAGKADGTDVLLGNAIVATKDIQNAMNALEKNDGTLMEPDARLAQR